MQYKQDNTLQSPTENNINRYRQQLDILGLSYDWDREVRTCDDKYYKWTQWTFLKLFGSYYCNDAQKARPIEELICVFEKEGNQNINAATSQSEKIHLRRMEKLFRQRKKQTF